MSVNATSRALKIFTTCPMSARGSAAGCLEKLEHVARWSEEAGCEGILVFSDNRQLDPWLVSQAIIESTASLCPLVAVQPAYMHPYAVAKMISSLAFLHGRRIYLNMVAGGFKNDLLALNDPTPHDERYARLTEYTKIIQQLCGNGCVTFEGSYYQVENLSLTPPVPPSLAPGLLISGSSDAGRHAAESIGATAIEYPQPAAECAADNGDLTRGIRIGLIARPDDAAAWRVARNRYPEDRKGQLTHKLAMKVSDSVWHKQLAERNGNETETDPYWLVPFQNYKAMCPYLVGGYERVAGELVRYVDSGYRTFILDEPASQDEMNHVSQVFEQARAYCEAA